MQPEWPKSSLELPSIGWQLFILDSSQSDPIALPAFLDTYATRLLTEPLRGLLEFPQNLRTPCEGNMPSYSSGCTEVSRGSRELTWRRLALLFAPGTPKLPNEPLKQGYPTFFSNLSSHSLIPISCSISASWCSQNSLM